MGDIQRNRKVINKTVERFKANPSSALGYTEDCSFENLAPQSQQPSLPQMHNPSPASKKNDDQLPPQGLEDSVHQSASNASSPQSPVCVNPSVGSTTPKGLDPIRLRRSTRDRRPPAWHEDYQMYELLERGRM